LEYSYGSKRGDGIGSFIYALPFSGLLSVSLLTLVTASAERRQTHIPWYRQESALTALLYLPLCLITLTGLINSLMNNNLPDAVALSVDSVGLLLLLVVFVQFVRVRRSKARAK
jgi:hypothetical protein